MPGQEQLPVNPQKRGQPVRLAVRNPAPPPTLGSVEGTPKPAGEVPHAASAPLRVVRAGEPAGQIQRSAWVYVRHALMHPWHIVVLAGAAVFGVANWSLLVLLLVFGGAELLLLAVVLRLRSFRRYVDGRLLQLDRMHAAEVRAALLLQMSEEHRRELTRLELVVDRIRDACRTQGAAAQLAVDECLGLLAAYVRLAISHHSSQACLASVDRRALDEAIHSLESLRFSSSPQTRRLAQQRLAIARKRAERWDRSAESLEQISQKLAMISELVQLTHEQVAAPLVPDRSSADADRLVEELDHRQATIDELAELLVVEEPIEPRILDLGRAART